MTKAKTAKAKGSTPRPPDNVMKVHASPGDHEGPAIARTVLEPDFRHGVAAAQIHKIQFGSMAGAPGFGDYADAIRRNGDAAAKGDLAFASRMLAAQAVTLDNIFTELAHRMALNMGEHLQATEIYARQAMKAQANSRATLEALAKLHQPREQTVRHVHVGQGGQAVVADEFHHHHHKGGTENGAAADQSHATGEPGAIPTLPSPNPLGDSVPIPGRAREAAMQDARRD